MTHQATSTILASGTNVAGSAASSRSRTIAYWVTTLILGTENIVGGVLGVIG
jgi:hypothetical protein